MNDGSWVLSTPTTTTLWLVLLGVGLVFAARVMLSIGQTWSREKRAVSRVRAAEWLLGAGVACMFLSVVAHIAGVA